MKRSLPNHLVALPLVLVACGAGAPVGAAGQRGPSGAGDSSGVDGGGNGQEYDTATGILFVSGRLYAVDAVADRVVRFAA